jgi:hypothetical protein
MTTRQKRADIHTVVHGDGALSATITHSDGAKQVVVIPNGHALMQHFAAHGLQQKVSAAINSGKDPADSAAKVDALESAFRDGRWTIRGDAEPKGGLLARALASLKGCPLDEAEAFVKGLSRAEQAELRNKPAVAAAILEVKRADADEGEDDSELLSGFLEQ